MAEGRRRRRWLRITALGFAALLAAFGIGAVAGAPVCWPADVAMNIGGAVVVPALRVGADGMVRVVVLQHGLFRTSASLWRLERTLRAHGYEVLNPGYPSTRERIADHAARLAAAIDARAAAGPVDEWSFVGHSMGGLVIQEYLAGPQHVTPKACVYLGTPHRGAMLADLRKHWFLFRWTMGTGASMELSPGDARYQRAVPFAAVAGSIAGDVGAGNDDIPGPDDGTVAVGEATLPGAAAALRLPVNHTWMTVAAPVITQVLHFLRHGGFAPVAGGQ